MNTPEEYFTMQDSQNTRRTPTARNWNASLLHYDLNQLQREREHLQRKAKERSLNSWEIERISQIGQEIVILVRTLAKRQIEGEKAA
jgi:hypothetical protein